MLRALLHVTANTGQLPETGNINLTVILNFHPDAGHTVFQAQNILLSAYAQQNVAGQHRRLIHIHLLVF